MPLAAGFLIFLPIGLFIGYFCGKGVVQSYYHKTNLLDVGDPDRVFRSKAIEKLVQELDKLGGCEFIYAAISHYPEEVKELCKPTPKDEPNALICLSDEQQTWRMNQLRPVVNRLTVDSTQFLAYCSEYAPDDLRGAIREKLKVVPCYSSY